MKEKWDQVKNLLTELEQEASDEQGQQFSKNFNALELPSIVSSVVEYLHPLLTPYEIAVYWFLFNKSIVKTGEQYARASTRGMSAIAKSASGKSDELSYGAIKKTIDALKEKEVLVVTGDTNRDGTLYKVSIPDEISLCKKLMQESSAEEIVAIETNNELDFYNIAENRIKVFERDSYKCHYCDKQLTRFSATLDHIQPVSKDGDNSFENLVTACLHCNSERGNKAVMDFITNGS
ncbi:MAG: HNH endonuclease [Candidatus Anammoxibacter sp.]